MTETAVYKERELENAIVTDRMGNIVYNGTMGDSPVIRREYTDGIIEIIRKSDGVILNRYRVDDTALQPTCQHCGKEPW